MVPTATHGCRHEEVSGVRQVVTVCPEGTGDARTIGEALARARGGAVLSVRPGTYEENLVVTTRVTIVAEQSRAASASHHVRAPRSPCGPTR